MTFVCFTVLAELFELKAFLKRLFVLSRVVIYGFACRALQFDHVILRHNIDILVLRFLRMVANLGFFVKR